MLKKVDFSKLHNDEHIQFNNDVLHVCTQADPTLLNILAQFNVLRDSTELMESAYLQIRGSDITKKIIAEDETRDNLITGIEYYVKSWLFYTEPQYVEAAERVMKHLKKYGNNISKLSYQAETTALKDLLDFMNTDSNLQAATTLLGLNNWFTRLETSNNAFNNFYMERVDEQAGKTKLSLKELRIESIQHYRDLTKYIEAQALITPSTLFDSVIGKLNELIDKYNHIRRKRKVDTEHGDDDNVLDD